MAGAMIQWFKSTVGCSSQKTQGQFTALMVAPNHPDSSYRGADALCWPHRYQAQAYMQTKHPYTLKKILNFLFRQNLVCLNLCNLCTSEIVFLRIRMGKTSPHISTHNVRIAGVKNKINLKVLLIGTSKRVQ